MILLKKAKESDIPTIQEIAKVTWQPTYVPIIGQAQVDYMLEKMYSTGALQEQLFLGHQFLIAEIGSRHVGFVSFSREEDESDVYHLHKLYVLPEAHGAGIGKFLMNEVVNKVREAEGRFLRLNVNRNNKAKAFYEKAGFKIIETVDLDIGNGFYMNDFVMEKAIEPA